jgi:hypothetical protein
LQEHLLARGFARDLLGLVFRKGQRWEMAIALPLERFEGDRAFELLPGARDDLLGRQWNQRDVPEEPDVRVATDSGLCFELAEPRTQFQISSPSASKSESIEGDITRPHV